LHGVGMLARGIFASQNGVVNSRVRCNRPVLCRAEG
jgi:hypothetical protein